MKDTSPVCAALLSRLWTALALGALSFAITTVQGIFRDGFDAWHQAVSALSLGPGGWIQMLNLVAFGLVVLTTVPAWRRILAGGKGATLYPVLTAMVGASFVVVGVIPQDPAPGYDPAGLALQAPTTLGLTHLAFAGVAALSSVIGLFVMAARFADEPAWRGWAMYSRATAIAVVGCVAVYGVWSTRSTGFGGTFERGAIVIPMIWMFAFLRRLDRGTPLIVASRATAEDASRLQARALT